MTKCNSVKDAAKLRQAARADEEMSLEEQITKMFDESLDIEAKTNNLLRRLKK